MSLETLKEAMTSYTKDVEKRLLEILESVPESVAMSALDNLLIRKCQKRKVNKTSFIQKMKDGWDYHEQPDVKSKD